MSAIVGFTPFAKEHLLTTHGFVKDTKSRRTFVLGGRLDDGTKVRREVTTTLRVAFVEYNRDYVVDRLWVKWSDGTRRLVHRKAMSHA